MVLGFKSQGDISNSFKWETQKDSKNGTETSGMQVERCTLEKAGDRRVQKGHLGQTLQHSPPACAGFASPGVFRKDSFPALLQERGVLLIWGMLLAP